jgi:hypothetical protein
MDAWAAAWGTCRRLGKELFLRGKENPYCIAEK